MPSFRHPRRGSGLFAAAALSAALLAGSPLGVSMAHAQPAAAPAAAPSAAQIDLARQLVVANGEARAFDGVIGNIVDGAALSFLQTNPDLVQSLREAAIAVRPEFEKRNGEIIDLLAKVYAQRFSEAELKDALAFYSSAVGKKLVQERPIIVQEALRQIQAWGAELNGEAVERVRAEMRKKGFDL